jgi:hypothetical protein
MILVRVGGRGDWQDSSWYIVLVHDIESFGRLGYACDEKKGEKRVDG